ncbi:hypothetical protein F4777DRAFT_580396 [Nemania sp. FL0916]|nr:hypothetical protein F4777DRAFT_580396 [Nemania sp. FL0916]
MQDSTENPGWRIVYYRGNDSDEGWESVLGMPYFFKIFIPIDDLRYHTQVFPRFGGSIPVLKNAQAYIRCRISNPDLEVDPSQPQEGSRGTILNINATWDGFAAQDGVFTFCSDSHAGGLYYGAEYCHSIEFFAAPSYTTPQSSVWLYNIIN